MRNNRSVIGESVTKKNQIRKNSSLINIQTPVREVAKLFAGRTTKVIAAISLMDEYVHAQILNMSAAKTTPMKAKLPKKKRGELVLSGIYTAKNVCIITGGPELRGYDAAKLDMLVEGFQTLTDVTSKRPSNLLLMGSVKDGVSIARIKGKWTILDDFQVFGCGENDEVYASRAHGTAIFAGTPNTKKGAMNWRQIHEGNKPFDYISKIVPTKDGFRAQIMTDGLTVPMTIVNDVVEFGQPTKWAGRILAPWFGTTEGLFTAKGDELTFTPKEKVSNKDLSYYMQITTTA